MRAAWRRGDFDRLALARKVGYRIMSPESLLQTLLPSAESQA